MTAIRQNAELEHVSHIRMPQDGRGPRFTQEKFAHSLFAPLPAHRLLGDAPELS